MAHVGIPVGCISGLLILIPQMYSNSVAAQGETDLNYFT